MASSARQSRQRLAFHDAMAFVELPPTAGGGGGGGSATASSTKRYMSTRPAWVTGSDMLYQREDYIPGRPISFSGTATYGGHVYAQSGLVAARCFESTQAASAAEPQKEYGIHTVRGYFAEASFPDRPFIYEVQLIAATTGLQNLLVTVRQPVNPSTNPTTAVFALEDSRLRLGPVCFTALVSFRPVGPLEVPLQEESPQQRFGDALSTSLNNASALPGLHVHRVDLGAFNKGKPLYERRELLLYRLPAPLPRSAKPSMHIMCHAFEADRNSLFMLGNQAGFGWDFGRAASLSYSYVVHVNPHDAVMQYGEDEWWIQEVSLAPEAGNGIVMSKLWSPEGVHIATEYQDGITMKRARQGKRETKL